MWAPCVFPRNGVGSGWTPLSFRAFGVGSMWAPCVFPPLRLRVESLVFAWAPCGFPVFFSRNGVGSGWAPLTFCARLSAFAWGPCGLPVFSHIMVWLRLGLCISLVWAPCFSTQWCGLPYYVCSVAFSTQWCGLHVGSNCWSSGHFLFYGVVAPCGALYFPI